MIAIDTNVVVYTADNRESDKQRQAISLLEKLVTGSEETILLWQVACEFLNWLRRREHSGHLTPAEVRLGFAEVVSVFPLALPSFSVFDR